VCNGQNIPLSGWDVNEIVVTYDTQIQLGDVVFLLDETCSMTDTLDDMKNNFVAATQDLQNLIPDLTYGVVSFDDYNYTPAGMDPGFGFGSGNDRPFHHRQQQTSDASLAQQALLSLSADGGDDWTEASVEALFQTATGYGYDQNCNGSFDSDADVLPFQSLATDAFGGTSAQRYIPGVPGTGDLGGNGFRTGAVPIFVYATDATIRNSFPPFGEGPHGNSPPTGCALDAATPMLFDALSDLNARAIGVAVGDEVESPIPAMEAIATATDSWLDFNGNGVQDSGESMVYSSTDFSIVDLVVDAIAEFTANVTYDMTMEAEDPTGALVSVDPPSISDVPAMSTVEFTITLEPTPATAATLFSDQVFVVPTTLLGDGAVVLAEWDLVFTVTPTPLLPPGS